MTQTLIKSNEFKSMERKTKLLNLLTYYKVLDRI